MYTPESSIIKLAKDKTEFWQEQNGIYQQIFNRGMEAYGHSLLGLKEAFAETDRVIRCMDERVSGGLRVAGSMILMDDEQAQEFVRKTQARGITSHDACGAAAIAYRQRNKTEEEKIDEEIINQFAKTEAIRLAEVCRIPYLGHIKIEEMDGLPDLHIARAVYYAGVTDFNPDVVPDLPSGFVISRFYLDPEYALSEVKTAVKIALDEHHGFGAMFTTKQPLLLIAVADPNNKDLVLDTLKTELAEVGGETGDRVKVDILTAPLT